VLRPERTVMNANGENPKVIQELQRHANLKVTMDTYVHAVSDEKRLDLQACVVPTSVSA
jgi:integrase